MEGLASLKGQHTPSCWHALGMERCRPMLVTASVLRLWHFPALLAVCGKPVAGVWLIHTVWGKGCFASCLNGA